MTKEIYFAGGCFWGTQHYFKQIRGIVDTAAGYANGNIPDPTYQEVYTDTTGYAETVKVIYDPVQIPLSLLVELYFKSIDPLSVNKQGEDTGTRYRTGIYFSDEEDLPVIRKVYDRIASQYDAPLAVELEPLRNFYPAEEYHQDYLDKNPSGYCHLPEALFEFARNYQINIPDWAKEINCAVTVCDTEGVIIYMNDKSKETFASYGDLVGKNLMGCHSDRSKEIIRKLIETSGTNCYTISKNGLRKMIYQTVWKKGGQVAGLVEISIVLPEDMPHYDRG